ncbi:unnamed protein product [Onchocerca flexuosa]|uniref:MRP-L46 domain-containing protein n=1 Tax=Onchocerca flexuosa TaxID=387005 RepID=A0A183HZL8_9BILA|nr:unnamed protein product [Onchocerca flexuosa]
MSNYHYNPFHHQRLRHFDKCGFYPYETLKYQWLLLVKCNVVSLWSGVERVVRNDVTLELVIIMGHRILHQVLRFHSSMAVSSKCSHVWDIFASVALIRPPIIAPPMLDIEKRYHDLMLQKELENSLRCDFELRQLRDERLLKERERLKMDGERANLQEEIGILASVDEENWRKEADRIRKELGIGDLTKVMHF